MNRIEKLKQFGKGIILIGLMGRLILALYVRNGGSDFLNADSDLYYEGRIACGLMVMIGYGICIWADCRKEKADSRESDSKADES